MNSSISTFISSITAALQSSPPLDKLIHEYYEIEGHQVEIRIEPPEFRQTVKEIVRLVDDSSSPVDDVKANEKIEEAYKKWGCDKELIRLHYFNSLAKDAP